MKLQSNHVAEQTPSRRQNRFAQTNFSGADATRVRTQGFFYNSPAATQGSSFIHPSSAAFTTTFGQRPNSGPKHSFEQSQTSDGAWYQ